MTIPNPPSQPGCEWAEECIEICAGKSVCVDELGVQAWFRNPERVKIRKIHYDGCFNKSAGGYMADYILGLPETIDIVIELKGSHTNLRHAYIQVVSTLETWEAAPNRYRKVAALIVYGAIRTKDSLPRRKPKALSAVQAVEGDFKRKFKNRIRLLIHESGEKQFTFNDFLRKNDAR
jgi:hypothetical protein